MQDVPHQSSISLESWLEASFAPWPFLVYYLNLCPKLIVIILMQLAWYVHECGEYKLRKEIIILALGWIQCNDLYSLWICSPASLSPLSSCPLSISVLNHLPIQQLAFVWMPLLSFSCWADSIIIIQNDWYGSCPLPHVVELASSIFYLFSALKPCYSYLPYAVCLLLHWGNKEFQF